MRRNTIALLVIAVVLAVAGFAAAQSPDGSGQTPATPSPTEGSAPMHPMMRTTPQASGTMMGPGDRMGPRNGMGQGMGQGFGMGQGMGPGYGMGQGHGMMTPAQEQLTQRLDAMDAELDGLVRKMNDATGKAKIQAMAAVIDELAAQRKEMRGELLGAERQMMVPMMRHMAWGMMQGMAQGMMQDTGPSTDPLGSMGSMGSTMSPEHRPCWGAPATAPESSKKPSGVGSVPAAPHSGR